MARALYRTYRSTSLADVVGQDHVTSILAKALQQGRIAHAYLLTGPRGVGKTSIARILAHEINQLPYDEAATHLDIIEIDAASNNGVEDVRDLRDKVQLAPVSAKRKVYIIDEVHMLSKPAFNALLKTLEEPPEHVVFILATTDANKLPETIISRTQRYNFRAITPEDAAAHLRTIADKEKITIDEAALKLIAAHGNGSFRDSIGLLDQLASLSDEASGVTVELVEHTLGLASEALIHSLIEAYESKQLERVVALLKESESLGVQPTILSEQLARTITDQIVDKPQLVTLLDSLIDVSRSAQPRLKLLVALAASSARPKTAALEAEKTEVISAPIAELQRQAIKPKPRMPKSPKAPETAMEQPAEYATPPSKAPTAPQDFDWQQLLDSARKNHIALHSVLAKCKPSLDGAVLTLYTGTSFYKKKLDQPKQRATLSGLCLELGMHIDDVDTIATPPPPTDSKLAAVAALMGGGEQITVEA